MRARELIVRSYVFVTLSLEALALATHRTGRVPSESSEGSALTCNSRYEETADSSTAKLYT